MGETRTGSDAKKWKIDARCNEVTISVRWTLEAYQKSNEVHGSKIKGWAWRQTARQSWKDREDLEDLVKTSWRSGKAKEKHQAKRKRKRKANN